MSKKIPQKVKARVGPPHSATLALSSEIAVNLLIAAFEIAVGVNWELRGILFLVCCAITADLIRRLERTFPVKVGAYALAFSVLSATILPKTYQDFMVSNVALSPQHQPMVTVAPHNAANEVAGTINHYAPVYNFDNSEPSGTSVADPENAAIYAPNSTNTMIENNNITTPGTAINLAYSKDASVKGNEINQSASGFGSSQPPLSHPNNSSPERCPDNSKTLSIDQSNMTSSGGNPDILIAVGGPKLCLSNSALTSDGQSSNIQDFSQFPTSPQALKNHGSSAARPTASRLKSNS